MVAVVAPGTSTAPQPSSSRVRLLESPTGRTLQKAFRFLAEWRPAVVLFAAMYNVIVASRAAINDFDSQRLLVQYVTIDAVNLTLMEARETLLDYSDLDGSWVPPLFGGSRTGNLRLFGLIVSLVLLTANTVVIAIPIFITFRQPTFHDPASELTDTALCFHINLYNQKKWLQCYRYAMMVFVAAAVVINLTLMQDEVAPIALAATYVPIAAAFASILFLFPFTKYNTMTYEEFASSYVADGQNARVDALPLSDLAMLLTYQGSKQRVLQEISRQGQEDALRAKGKGAMSEP